jgi:single-strand DNA-binding protein
MVNKVILIGNLGKDPEVKRFEGGGAVAKFSVATTDAYKDKEGNWQDQTEWHDVVVWRDLAERAEKQLKKGSKVYVEGKLTHRKYTDANGVDKYITEVLAATFRSLDKREGTSENTAPQTQTATPAQKTAKTVSDSMPSESDLPF